jgi:hypothetical protein
VLIGASKIMAQKRRRMTAREARFETRFIYVLLVGFVVAIGAVLYFYFTGAISNGAGNAVQ